MSGDYSADEPARGDIDALKGPAIIEFGTSWCGYCRAARPLIDQAFAAHAGLRHLKIEDGKGRRLGRSFQVKLWPTLVFLQDGKEIARVVRPQSAATVAQALALIEAPGQ